MDGAKVKDSKGARFAMKPDDSGKPAEVEKPAHDDITLRGFAKWSFWLGMAGWAAYLFTDWIASDKILLSFCSAFLTLYGGILWWHTARYDKTMRDAATFRHTAEEQIAQAARDLSAEKQASAESIAKAKDKYNKQLEKKLAAMNEEMEARTREAADKYEELESEKRGVERENQKLTLTLNAARETLSYYADRAQVDVYEGEDALYDGWEEDDNQSWRSEPKRRKRKCGGVYVVNNAADGKVKIGETGNFAERFFQIQSQCGSSGIEKEDIVPVVLVPMDEGRYEIEQTSHAALKEYRTSGEWFKVAPEKAVAVVLGHVHKRRVNNFEERTKLPIGKGDKE